MVLLGCRGRRAVTAMTAAMLMHLAVAPADADLSDVRKRKSQALRVLVVDGAPEFFSWDVKSPGLEGEILYKFCQLQRLTGYEIVRQPSAAAAIAALLRGEGDVAAGGLMASPGEGRLEFSAEVLPSRSVIVTRKPAVPVRTLDQLRSEKVGTVSGSAERVATAGLAVVEDSLGPVGLLSALKAGRLSAGVLGIERAIPARASDPDLQLGIYVGPKISIAFALRKDDPQLRLALNEYITNVRRSATWNRLVLKYFGDSASEILKATR
jgi:membrane-bound lytic murein transglycosylase F